jgi:hypothetical protein
MISDKRIEAARVLLRQAAVWRDGEPPDFAIETVAHALLAAKVEGLREAARFITGYRETVPGREPGPLALIGARIAALETEER